MAFDVLINVILFISIDNSFMNRRMLFLSVYRAMILILYLIPYFIHISQSYVELYHTEDSSSIEIYDCIHYKNESNVLFCRRPGNIFELNRRQKICFPDSKNLFFSNSQQWSSSIEKADEYAAHLSYSSIVDHLIKRLRYSLK